MSGLTMTDAQVKERGEVQKLCATEDQFIGKKGYKRTYRSSNPADGYDWTYTYKPNNGAGKLTPEGGYVMETMRPWMKADTERQARNQAAMPRVPLMNGSSVEYVTPEKADQTARVNGWRHRWSGRANVSRGTSGEMLWRWASGWMPLGVRCLGEPIRGSRYVSKRGLQYDPDGFPWKHVAGEWRMI